MIDTKVWRDTLMFRDISKREVHALLDELDRLTAELDRYRWHPYPQEKPKDDGYYQITTTALTIYDDHYSTKIDEWETFLPVAFRPMPEAYKPEVSND